ncbi:DisA checkpoint controller-like protein [Orenia metallireducens]|uniref:DisA checkpoint controller nucleotide-binding n=1 Tax=Orenia metallireducens TaxID=1413210 RepID=A0A285HXL6_9FIRM|nr:diadenylate cyclase [Orenia metallireducens]PRX29258.1 DisA checkpoint controller-like protein [Orenia metallireducens]SNY40478.1 DisA checkpoint controller nucleotide-binding [Orenia metallireducens]
MDVISEIYCSIKELFGPKINVEILKTDQKEFSHIIGKEIYQTVKNRKELNERELAKILGGDNYKEEDLPINIKDIKPNEIFKNALNFNDFILINLEQFPSFSRLINFTYNSNRYLIVLSSPLLNHQENIELLKIYIAKVKDRIKNRNNNIMIEYLKTFIPSNFCDKFELIYNLLIKMSMQKIENKNADFGLIFVNRYLDFKEQYSDRLFFDLNDDYDIRNIELVKQPFMEVAGGEKSFLLVNNEFKIKGIFFPNKSLKGLKFIDRDPKELQNCLIARIKGINLIRMVCNNKVVFDMQNGLTRTRDYNSFHRAIKKVLISLGFKNNYNNFLSNLIEISNLKKGTILVIGKQVEDNKYSKCISGNISLVNNDVYRKSVLTQLSLTDGAVLIDNSFNIYGFGAILNIYEKNDDINNSGGSRSYIARQFAKENQELAVIKISEDGPISVYYKGECKIEI